MNPQQLPIKSPCTQDWNSMEGSGRLRHCESCNQSVHNLSAMTRAEAQKVVERRQAGQRLCVRYTLGEDGEIVFQRAPLIPAGLLVRTRQVALRATLAAAAVAGITDLPGCVPAGPVSGAVASRLAAGEVAEQLGEAGTCSISLEPLLPLSLTLHAAACAPKAAEPVQMLQGQLPILEEPPKAPVEAPPPSQTEPTPAPAGESAEHAAPVRKTRAAKKATPKKPPVEPRHLMGDVAF